MYFAIWLLHFPLFRPVAPKLSPLEQILQLLLFLEKNVLYPLTFLFAFGLSALHYKAVFGDL